MKLSDAPVSYEGFFVTNFFVVRDQEKSKDVYVRILGGNVMKSENPCYIELHPNGNVPDRSPELKFERVRRTS